MGTFMEATLSLREMEAVLLAIDHYVSGCLEPEACKVCERLRRVAEILTGKIAEYRK